MCGITEDVEAEWKYCTLCFMLYIVNEVLYEFLRGVAVRCPSVCVVGHRAFCFREPALVKCLGKNCSIC